MHETFFTNPVFPTFPWIIPCIFPVKVTYKTSKKKSAKAKTKKLTYTLTVAKASVALSGDSVVAVGDTAALTTTKKASSRATITYISSDDTVATVDSATGAVTGVKAGKATITAKLVIGKDTAIATKDVEVKNVILKSAAQKKASQIVATFAGDTSKLDKKDITITNTANNVVYPVKAISVAADKKTVTIDTFSEMNDAKEYSVKYDGTEVKFTATDGVVADVALDKTTIVKGSAGSVVKAQFLDKNNIVVKEFTLSDAKSEGSVDYRKQRLYRR